MKKNLARISPKFRAACDGRERFVSAPLAHAKRRALRLALPEHGDGVPVSGSSVGGTPQRVEENLPPLCVREFEKTGVIAVRSMTRGVMEVPLAMTHYVMDHHQVAVQ